MTGKLAGTSAATFARSTLTNSTTRCSDTDLTAAFQYDRQPWSLAVNVSPRQSRVHVTPQYDLELLPEEARLNVRLAYQNFGARAFAVPNRNRLAGN